MPPTQRSCGTLRGTGDARLTGPKGADITDPDVLQEMADRVGLGPRSMADIAADPHYKAVIGANTREAVEAGLFGVPRLHLPRQALFRQRPHGHA